MSKATRSATNRMMADIRTFKNCNAPLGVIADPPDGRNFTVLDARILGPEDTPWEGGVFNIRIEFPKDYPNAPPAVKFTDPVPYHPNVYANGTICVDVLQDKWSPQYEVASVLAILQSLLGDPNPASPANDAAAKAFVHDRPGYDATVREQVRSTFYATRVKVKREQEEEGLTREASRVKVKKEE